MRHFKITVEYDGSSYCGWQRQGNGISVQQVLEDAVAGITGRTVSVIGSGRTDAGVHAIHQVAGFACATALPVYKLWMGINSLLPADIVVKSLEEVSAAFHPLRDAKSKVYIYRICNRRLRPVIGRQYLWHVRYPLDVVRMRRAAGYLKGTHDFSSFCATGTDVKNRVRTVVDIRIRKGREGLIEIEVEALGFLKYMVRNIVGTLVEIGRGKREPKDMKVILQAKNRKEAGVTAPACGLFLKEVKY